VHILGTLYVVATPIGNLDDLSPRALRVLGDVSLIAAEDTRHSRRLLTHFGISTPLVSYHKYNERERRTVLLDALAAGDVALISDAGTPAISDPGADLVAAALDAGHRVSPIPGPSSLAAAVSGSGLIDGPFTVLGFLPRERGARTLTIAKAAVSQLPLVIFESANRLEKTISDLEQAMGNRRAVVLRELTKFHEEIRQGDLPSLRSWAASGASRGEIVLVVGGAERRAAATDDAKSVVETLRHSGLSASQAAREAATITGLPRSELYELARAVDARGSIGLEGELTLPDEDALQQSLRDEEGPQGRQP
jgi:16S rRNA (cytidine1402-2'-O)-methyltransferase